MTRIEYLKIVWQLLSKHRLHFFLCVSLIMCNSVIMGGALTSVLPVLNSLFAPSVEAGNNGGEYFNKVLTLYNQIIPDTDHKELILMGILFILMMVNMTVTYIIVRVNGSLTAKLSYDFRAQIYKNIQNRKTSAIQAHPWGMYTQLLITEIRNVYVVFRYVLSVIATFFNVGITILLLVLLSWKLSSILFIGSIVLVCINFNIVKHLKKLGASAFALRTHLMSQATDAIVGLQQIKLLQAGSSISRRLNSASWDTEDMARHILNVQGFQAFLTGNFNIGIIFIIIVFWFFSPVFSEGISGTAGILTFLILMSKLATNSAAIAKGYGAIFANIPSVLKVTEYLSGNIDCEVGGSHAPDSFFENRITLNNIHFTYPPDKPVLRGITMEIKRGSYIGIVGASGGGKSTLLNLLARIYDPDEGEILIDEINIKEFKLSYLRSHIGMVSQDFFLFNTSIRENLLLAKPSASEQDLWSALKKAGLCDFVDSLDKKIDSPVGNNGNMLSGGQRQRLCLAIIFLLNPDIIILDEGTSSVDRDTENHILSSLRALHQEGKTVISTSHKESALADAEYMYQLTDGRLHLLSSTNV